MSRIVYVDGRYLPYANARVHVEDRGFQFADSVYEVCAVRAGHLVDEEGHLNRLARSLSELDMREPLGTRQLRHVMRETVRLNLVQDGLVYVQVTRGVARRDHGFPPVSVKPTLVVTARSLDLARYQALADRGVAVICVPETRWARCDVKSTSLLANVLAKQEARTKGAFEAWFVDAGGRVTEGSSTTAWIVDDAGTLRTRHLDRSILPGITRSGLLALCAERGVAVQERAFTPDEAQRAREAMVSAASFGLLPVASVDRVPLKGKPPGPVFKLLEAAYWSGRIG